MSATPQQPRILVVGGHTRDIGKTALVVDLIRAFPEAAWTAVKVTQYGHGVCTQKSEGCQCAPAEHTMAIDEDLDPSRGTDTSRYLAAGAAHALWLRAKQGRLAEAMPLLRDALKNAGNVILESNTVLQFSRPALYLLVLDPRKEDFKPSAKQALDRADAYVLRSVLQDQAWPGVSPRLLATKPFFIQPLGSLLPEGLGGLVRERFFTAGTVPAGHS